MSTSSAISQVSNGYRNSAVVYFDQIENALNQSDGEVFIRAGKILNKVEVTAAISEKDPEVEIPTTDADVECEMIANVAELDALHAIPDANTFRVDGKKFSEIVRSTSKFCAKKKGKSLMTGFSMRTSIFDPQDERAHVWICAMNEHSASFSRIKTSRKTKIPGLSLSRNVMKILCDCCGKAEVVEFLFAGRFCKISLFIRGGGIVNIYCEYSQAAPNIPQSVVAAFDYDGICGNFSSIIPMMFAANEHTPPDSCACACRIDPSGTFEVCTREHKDAKFFLAVSRIENPHPNDDFIGAIIVVNGKHFWTALKSMRSINDMKLQTGDNTGPMILYGAGQIVSVARIQNFEDRGIVEKFSESEAEHV